MNESVARELLSRELATLRTRSYESLRDELLQEPYVKTVVGPDGEPYQVEIHAFWDDKPAGDLRVRVSIDDGRGWRAFSPRHDDFIISPSGEFVGE